MILSVTYANNFLNFLLGKVEKIEAPAEIWLGLCSNDPEADGGTFTEITGNGYSRKIIAVKGETYPAEIGTAASREIGNKEQIAFNKATGDYSVKGIGLFAAKTGGTPFAWGKLNGGEAVQVVSGALPLFEKENFGLYMLDGVESTT